jgi:hypothetical protein
MPRTFEHEEQLWAEQLASEARDRALKLPLIHIPTATPDRYTAIRVEQDVAVPMRDGVRLYANIYRPDAEGRFPVVLIRMPYGKDEFYCYMPAHGRYWARKGYICVIQDVRGKYTSEGVFEPFVNEAQDGYDTLDWVAAQPWCDGSIGMTGESYFGYTQWAAASLGHPALKCIVPGNTAANIYGVWFYVDHVWCLQTMGIWSITMNSRKFSNWFRLKTDRLPLVEMDSDAGLECDYYKRWVTTPERDAMWDRINIDQHYGRINIPVLSWGGWYDTFLKGTIDDWLGMRAHARSDAVREHQWLLLSPNDHETTPWRSGHIGHLDVGQDAWTYDFIQRFFDRYLMGKPEALPDDEGRVRYFVMGANQWRTEGAWPPARAVYTPYYLHSSGRANTLHGDGRLSRTPPDDQPADHYTYDPVDPISVSAQTDLWSLAWDMKDRQVVEARGDVLVYTSDLLTSDLEVTGPLRLILYASSSAPDTDFTATLVNVFPDGYAHLVQEGIVRARYHTGQLAFIEPGQVYRFEIDLWATSYIFKTGHRLRVEVSSSNFDRYDRNLNTTAPTGTGREMFIAQQTIYHTVAHPSHILLPICQ